MSDSVISEDVLILNFCKVPPRSFLKYKGIGIAMKYDYLIVGAGLFGAVFAHEAKRAGKNVLVIDKRPQIGGMCIRRTLRASMCTSMGPIFSIRI